MADYVAQNSPPDMSFRVMALKLVLIIKVNRMHMYISRYHHIIYKNYYKSATQELMHYDMFAGARNMQRTYCALSASDPVHGCLDRCAYVYV